TAVTVIFNRPVVPLLTYEEQAELPNPVVFDPPIEGQGEWVNTSVFIFRADEAFIGRQTYTARVVADVVNEASATGAVLAADYQWSFTVTAPTINRLSLPGRESHPRDNYEHLPLDQDFEVYFNQPMNQAATEAAVSLACEGGQVPLQFAWNETNTMLAITPTVELDLATRYVFSVSDTATSAEGGRLRAGLVWNAITSLPPAIIDAEPADGATQRDFRSYFTLYFASRMDRESLEEKVIFDPPLATTPAEGYYSPWEWSLRFYGLQPSTTYTVRVLPGMSDPHGNLIDEEATYTFTTAAYDPTANLEMSGVLALYRQGGSTAIWSSYRNVSELDVDLYAITPRQFHQIVNDREFGERTYAPPSSNEFRVWSQTVDVDAAENTRGYKRLELLNESGDELPAGFYYVTLNADEVEYTTRHLAGRAILLANANVTLKTTLTEAMIWVTDLDTGEPLADVPVTFYNESFIEVFSGTTDADGLVYQGDMSLDPVYDSRYYAIADGEGVFGAAFNGWDDGTNPYDFGIYTDYYTEPDRPQTYVYTDRPLYRPGQNVEIKGVVRFNDDLDYSLPDFETVYVNISSYDGQVFEGNVSISEFGTFLVSLELDDEATLGGYFIDIRTRENNGEYIGGGSFDVAEFRKPTYQVNVTAAESDVALGDTLRATIKAEYFSGGSVIGGQAYWNVSTAPYTFS
ncbi:MAG: Ig-like domain-containing protein, partial [Anaerolineales bacterium]|nr:Ig-like domain-containing protein [Anaerolineales bacterium]